MFLAGLKNVLKVTNDSPVLVEVRNGTLYIGSYNDYHGIVYECPTEWDDMKTVLNINSAQELVKQMTTDEDLSIVVSEDGHRAKVTFDKTKLNLTVLTPDSMNLSSLMKRYIKEPVWHLDGTEFSAAVSRVSHSSNYKALGDVVLRGYHLTKLDNSLEVMASTGATLTVSQVPLHKSTDDNQEVLLLNPEFQEVSDLLYEHMSVAFDEQTISITSWNDTDEILRVVSALTQGNPFNYRELVTETEETNTIQLTFSTKDLLAGVRKNSFFTDDKLQHRLEIELHQEHITLSSRNVYGEVNAQVPVLETNLRESISLSLRSPFMVNLLANTRSETITLHVRDGTSPVLFDSGLSKEIMVVFIT